MQHLNSRFSVRVPLLAALALLSAGAMLLAAPAGAAAAGTTCPTFQVLHNDQIGKLKLKAGTYNIKIANQRKLACSSASDLFRQFLQDYDGVLPDGWRVQARRSRFVNANTGAAFAVSLARGGGGGGGGGSDSNASGRACPSPFSVLHNDSIGTLKIPAGKYRITVLAVGALSCERASKIFSRFLQFYDGVLPGNWRLDPKTATFSKTTTYGFRIEPFR